jgi:hypothetical protein
MSSAKDASCNSSVSRDHVSVELALAELTALF